MITTVYGVLNYISRYKHIRPETETQQSGCKIADIKLLSSAEHPPEMQMLEPKTDHCVQGLAVSAYTALVQ